MRNNALNLKKHLPAMLLVSTMMLLVGCAPSQPAVYQVSTLQALMQGAYEGQVPCRDLTKYGNLGIGTFDALDGEMIVLDSQVYQCTADGKVIRNPATTTPFADIVRFQPDGQADVSGPLTMQQLLALLDSQAGSKNLFYAVRIDGSFSSVKVRSVPRQDRPYPPLAQAATKQRVFDLQNVRGTIVAFRFPDYAGGVNMPGWHLHFISEDRLHGGHVLELTCDQGSMRLQTIRRFEMVLPDSGTFVSADLSKDMSRDIHQVEK